MTTLTEHAYELAAKLGPLENECGELFRLEHKAEVGSMARRQLARAGRVKQQEVSAIQDEIARLFGESRGWKLSNTDFGWRTLARRTTRVSGCRYTNCREYEAPPWCDHNWHFRQGRKAAAIATHPYNYKRDECEAFARRYHLGFEVVTDWPSWHCPGSSIFLLWTAPEIGLTAKELNKLAVEQPDVPQLA